MPFLGQGRKGPKRVVLPFQQGSALRHEVRGAEWIQAAKCKSLLSGSEFLMALGCATLAKAGRHWSAPLLADNQQGVLQAYRDLHSWTYLHRFPMVPNFV